MYLNPGHLRQLDEASFQAARPHPWLNPEGPLTEAGHQRLLDVSLFRPVFGPSAEAWSAEP